MNKYFLLVPRRGNAHLVLTEHGRVTRRALVGCAEGVRLVLQLKAAAARTSPTIYGLRPRGRGTVLTSLRLIHTKEARPGENWWIEARPDYLPRGVYIRANIWDVPPIQLLFNSFGDGRAIDQLVLWEVPSNQQKRLRAWYREWFT